MNKIHLDFAHAVRLPAGEIDKGFLHGIRSFLLVFKVYNVLNRKSFEVLQSH